VILIVEHDLRFAEILRDKAHELGFKGVIVSSGEAALQLAREVRPVAMTLDLHMPDMDGWVVLDRLKHQPATRHIPVHIISIDDSWQRGLKLGAFAFLKKPVSKKALDEAFASIKGFVERRTRALLVVEDHDLERESIVTAIGNGDVQITAVATAAAALELLRTRPFDCMVLDLNLPDMSGLELLETVKRELDAQQLRAVVYTGRDLTPREKRRLDEMSETIIVKDARSLEQLVEKTSLFLHRVWADLQAAEGAAESRPTDPALAGKKVLIVDDDVRNIFALASKLERWNLVPLRAENGRQALEVLRGHPDIDLAIIDIMMPDMDGHETIRAIRQIDQFRNLPIIALTAKAMKDDRRKCLDAGASDYLAKPVGGEQLFSMLRVWLQRHADQASRER
jgi:CheY-like chemotaxis protein